jgi:hypothetical protein
MQKAAWAIVGLLVGVLIATAIPAGAHHGNGLRALKQRVEFLENRVETVEFDVYEHGRRLSSEESSTSTFRSDISSLKSRTSKLDTSGNYSGLVYGANIRSSGVCGHGDPAIWEFSLGC